MQEKKKEDHLHGLPRFSFHHALFKKLVWKNPKDERINTPNTINKINWSYKYRPSIEEIVSHKKLTKIILRVELLMFILILGKFIFLLKSIFSIIYYYTTILFPAK